MEWFDAYDEVAAAVERFVAEYEQPPKMVSVSGTLYTWLAKLQQESAAITGEAVTEPVTVDSPYGSIPVVVDEHLDPYEIVPQ